MALHLARDMAGEYYDVYHGVDLPIAHSAPCGGSGLHGVGAFTCDVVRVTVEGHGIGSVLSTPPGGLSSSDRALLQRMAALTRRPLSKFSRAWRGPLPQSLTPSPRTSIGRAEAHEQGMVRVALGQTQAFTFHVVGSEIEDGCCPSEPWTGYYDTLGIDVQYPWEVAPGREHTRTFNATTLLPFYIDEQLVTNALFAAFMQNTTYTPTDAGNFLRHWQRPKPGAPPVPSAGSEKQPVRWVSLEDARVYCAWRGARLPQEVEWQLAAQGHDLAEGAPARLYPWGSQAPDRAGLRVPKPRLVPPFTPDDVGAHPSGASSFGVQDLVGNVWQWTSELVDERTRAATLRGGSSYQPSARDQFGDNWYFPGGAPYTLPTPPEKPAFVPFGTKGHPWGVDKYPEAYQLRFHAKLLLMAPSLDRSAGVGFRCAADAED